MKTSASTAYINAMGTVAPQNDVHARFISWATTRLPPDRRKMFARMVNRACIEHRWSVLPKTQISDSITDHGGFYGDSLTPSTAARMSLYANYAPLLALDAVKELGEIFEPEQITHIVVASCTGFIAPGIDQILATKLGLRSSVERLTVGFMGCYAAVTALKTARHIVRSNLDACVLVITVELPTLHLAIAEERIEPLLAMLQFGDGAAAAIVSASACGIELKSGFAVTLPDSADLITWKIGDQGFTMHLSGEVPGRIAEAFTKPTVRNTLTGGQDVEDIGHWAVHAGGRSILDAVEHGLRLPPNSLANSRAVLRDYGNMSSATLMFVLARFMRSGIERPGIAIAFGPGLAAEGLLFGPAA